MDNENEIFGQQLLKKVKDIENGLNYYINRNKQLETELEVYKAMYENRVNEYLNHIAKEN